MGQPEVHPGRGAKHRIYTVHSSVKSDLAHPSTCFAACCFVLLSELGMG
jgi:hypothetical protein